MKITNIRLRQVSGVMETQGSFWEERLVQPIDIYPEYRQKGAPHIANQIDETHYRVQHIFLEIQTDEGVSGIAGPTQETQAYLIAKDLRPILAGKDPVATELLWDQMHRLSVHGRQGRAMMAISVVDCALWDLKGRWLNQPVHRLIGGPTRPEVPAYASMLGYSVEDLGLVRERAREAQAQGFRAQKWFFRHGPMSGAEGVKKNVELVRTLREALGDDDDIMLDCWQSWDYGYTVRMARLIEPYSPRWLEECAMPDRIDTYAQIRQKIAIPMAGAEHEYTRWGIKRFVDAEALDILQPDVYWVGGLSELLKIAAYATTHDLITIPHAGSSPAGMHFNATQSPIHTPYVEHLVKWGAITQHFFKTPTLPHDGAISVPETPGLGTELNPEKIEEEKELRF